MTEFDKTLVLLRELGLFDPGSQKDQRAVAMARALVRAQIEREDREEQEWHAAILEDIAGSPG